MYLVNTWFETVLPSLESPTTHLLFFSWHLRTVTTNTKVSVCFLLSDSVDWWVNRFSLGLATGSSLKGSRPSQSQGCAIIICRSSIERWYQVWNVLPSNERNSQMCMWGGKRHQQTNCMQYCQTGYSIIKPCWPARHQLSSFESLTGAEPRYQPENC